MRLPRFTIAGMMTAVAVAAFDCVTVLIAGLVGVILISVALNYGFYRWWRSKGPGRRFWTGFEAAGAAAVLFYLVSIRATDSQIGLIHELPMLVLNLLESFPSATVRRVMFWLETSHEILFFISLFELTLGLPMLAIAFGGGRIAMSVGSRRDSRSRAAEAHGATPGPAAPGPPLLDSASRAVQGDG